MTDLLEKLRDELSDRYRIERELGSGGMATVYLAEDLKHERLVAIKVLHPQLAATIGAVRFLREVKIAANLSHPHILPLHDSGEAGLFLYYVMPYIEGESLRDRLSREGKLPPADATRILKQVADALSYAHARGIVHRDIKPENVMLTGRNAVVADFGIAKAVSDASSTSKGESVEDLTSVGVVIGTPAYMAPEQAMGDPTVDQRVDIYAWGVMAYEMLTGRQPFIGRNQQEILSAKLTQPAEPITGEDAAVNDSLPGIISKSLALDPNARWQTVDELLPQLEDSESRGAAGPLNRAWKFAMGAALIVVLAVSGWMVVRLLNGDVSRSGSPPRTSIAVLPFSDLSEERDNEFFSDGLADELIASLSRLTGLQVVGRTSAFWFKDKKDDLQSIGEQLKVGSIVDGSVRRVGDRVRVSAQLIEVRDGFQLWSDTYERELNDIFAVQEDVAQSIASALEIELSADDASIVRSGTDNVDAYSSYLLGRFHWNKRTAADMVVAASHFEEATRLDPEFAGAWSGLADSYVLFPPYGVEDLTWNTAIARAETAARKAVALDSTSAEAQASLAIVLDAQWDWDGAEAAFQRALAANPQYATAQQWYAIFLVGMDRIQDGLEAIKRAEQLDPLSPIIGTWVGLVLDVAGQTDQATAQFEKVLALHPNVAAVRRDAWLHFVRLSHFERAAVHLERYLELTDSPFAARWPEALRNPASRATTLREIADSTSDSFKQSTALYMILGEKEIALRNLESFLSSPSDFKDSAGALRAYILNDELRREPRFRALIANMGLSWN